VPSVFADPQKIQDPVRFARKVSALLNIPARDVLSKIRDRTKRSVRIAQKVNPALGPEIKRLGLEGLWILEEGMRLYPGRELASQVVGSVGSEGEGRGGLERYYDRFLRSRKLVVKTGRDRLGRAIFSDDTLVLEPEPGADLYLTLDSVIQHLVERELNDAARESRSASAMAVVMDPSDGRVLAMASYPPVNSNRVERLDIANMKNRPVEELYEPGSTFKLFSLAAALETPGFSVDRRVQCTKGSLRVNGKTIRSHTPHEWLTPREILKFSDNIGTARIALQIGAENIRAVLKRFGFDNQTGIEFPSEPNGLLAPASKWRDVDLANISFGQGVGVTAIQLVTAISMIANGGMSVRPYLFRKARFADGKELGTQLAIPQTRVISERTAKTMRAWMEAVTEPDGTGTLAKIPGYRTAGKTGTSQKPDPATRGYSEKRVVSSFGGFVPASNPKLAAIFVFDDPAKGDFGSQLAAPVFRRALEATLSYLNIPPDEGNVARAELPKFEPAPIVDSPKELFQDAGLLPDLRGLTVREVLSKAQGLSIDVKVIGNGVAVRQMPEAGRLLSKVQRLNVYFDEANRRKGAS
jgi:cell division protein FtsI (penicillin-binding protein 3)